MNSKSSAPQELCAENGRKAGALSDRPAAEAPTHEEAETHSGARMAGLLAGGGGDTSGSWVGLLTAGNRAGTRRRRDSTALGGVRCYRALVEQIPAVTFMAPLDGTTSELYVSPQIEELLGFSAQEWLDDPFLWYRQLHPDDQVRWTESFARTCFTGERVPRFAPNSGLWPGTAGSCGCTARPSW